VLAATIIYGATQLALLVLFFKQRVISGPLFIAAASLSFVKTPYICTLSVLEHSRTFRPSILLNVYLFLSILFDAVQSRTLLLISASSPGNRLFASAVVVKAIILLLEAHEKKKWLRPEYKMLSPEETCGPFSISSFFWLNVLILKGSHKILLTDDLYPLHRSLAAKSLAKSVWDQHERLWGRRGKWKLLILIFKNFKWSLLAPVPPRIAMMGFEFCQPFLINRITKYLASPRNTSRAADGYGLIGAAVITYVGIAVSKSNFAYQHERFLAKCRGLLVSTIYERTTELRISSGHDSTLTLMSNDVERIRMGLLYIHNLWADLIQATLSSYLLYGQLGAIFAIPLGVVFLCFLCSLGLGRASAKRQTRWSQELQKRVGHTAHLISNMKSLKMSGLVEQMTSLTEELRDRELKQAARFRMIAVWATIISFIPQLLAPVLTFAGASKTLDTSTIFTSMSYLLLLTSPMAGLFQIIPTMVASMACVERIANFLNSDSRIEHRKFTPKGDSSPENGNEIVVPHSNSQKTHKQQAQVTEPAPDINRSAILIQNGHFGWEREEFTLNDINLAIARSQLTMIVGPIGSGKSTLCKALLGEIPFSQGDVLLDEGDIGFCDQIPFLPNASVRSIIVGFFEFQHEWYEEIVDATALRTDIETWTDGDKTIVGTKGAALSGGQRHRISLARALYSRAKLMIFDDPFSGLDRNTEDYIFHRVFGSQGILQRLKTTVVLSTHAIKHLPNADHIILLGSHGRVVNTGHFNQLVETGSLKALEKGMFSNSDRAGVEKPRAVKSKTDNQFLKAMTEDQARQRGDLSIYRHYFDSVGLFSFIPFILIAIGIGFVFNFSTIWLKFWSDWNTSHPNARSRRGYYISIYAMLNLLCLAEIGFFVWYNTIIMAIKAGRNYHSRALSTVMGAPLLFYSTVDVGVTINRFSQDLNVFNAELPNSLLNTGTTTALGLGQAAVAAVATPYIAAGYPVLVLLLYYLQKFYLKTSRQLRFMDLEAKSPL
jgi:ATP-binding cassette subfamily C (CFTR/MRP) protein 1